MLTLDGQKLHSELQDELFDYTLALKLIVSDLLVESIAEDSRRVHDIAKDFGVTPSRLSAITSPHLLDRVSLGTKLDALYHLGRDAVISIESVCTVPFNPEAPPKTLRLIAPCSVRRSAFKSADDMLVELRRICQIGLRTYVEGNNVTWRAVAAELGVSPSALTLMTSLKAKRAKFSTIVNAIEELGGWVQIDVTFPPRPPSVDGLQADVENGC
ncbi:hypothetical protein [Tranquillimonas alkanivorans]|nr:hypothetical protein [Tranquillimonas alkanivorans]